MKRFGIFNKPLKRDLEQDQVLSGATFTEEDDENIVFAGSKKAESKPIGNLEVYLSQLSVNNTSNIDISGAEVVDIDAGGNNKTVSEIAAATEDALEILGPDAIEEVNEEVGVQVDDAYVEDSVEENLSDNAVDFENNGFKNDENLSETSDENSITEAEEFIGIDADSEQFNNFSAENENVENNKYVISEVEVDEEISSFEEECEKQLEAENNFNDTIDTVKDSDKDGVEVEIKEVITEESGKDTNDDSVIVFDSDSNKNDEVKADYENLVPEDVHNNLVSVKMSMKEKFISLDITEKKDYVCGLLAEFDELSEYLVEYRAKIDQKISDLVNSIKSLYTQIGTCDLDEARGIVEKIQKYSKHNEALTELKEYIDSI